MRAATNAAAAWRVVADLAAAPAFGTWISSPEVFETVVFCLGIWAFLGWAVAVGAAFLALLSLDVAVFPTVWTLSLSVTAGFLPVAGFAVTGLTSRIVAVAVFFPAATVLGLAFAAALFTEVFGDWLLLVRTAAGRRAPLSVAGAPFTAALVALRDEGRADMTRDFSLRVFADEGLASAGGRALVVDFLVALVAAAAAFVVAALFLGGMA